MFQKSKKIVVFRKKTLNFFQQSLTGQQEMLHYRRGHEAEAARVNLTRPLTKRELLPSLQYLCRFTLKTSQQKPPTPKTAPLPPTILKYLSDSKWIIPDLKKCEEQLKLRFCVINN